MSNHWSLQIQRILEKTALVVEQNTAMKRQIKDLEQQVVHLQEVLLALQAEYDQVSEQLQQRNLALAVQGNSAERESYSQEKIAELVREIDRCLNLLSA